MDFPVFIENGETFRNSYDDKKDLKEFLRENYSYILEEIEKEGYNLDFLEYDIFSEIVYNGYVVGFITFQHFNPVMNHYAINESYIIPEYRGNNLLFINLFNYLLFENFEFFPRNPNKAFINVLLKNDFAIKLSSSFVLSFFKFTVDLEDIYKNSKIKRFYKKPDSEVPYKANLFDLDLCSVMFRDPICNFVKYEDFLALTKPRKFDMKKYKCNKKLKKVSAGYLEEKYDIWVSDMRVEPFIERKKEEFNQFLEVDNLIGTEDKLSDEFIYVLNEFDLSLDDGFKIRQDIVNDLDNNQLSLKSYYQRVLYLLDNNDSIGKNLENYDDFLKKIDDYAHYGDLDSVTDENDNSIICPFCGTVIPDYVNSCLKCGLRVRDIDFEQHTREQFDLLEDEFINKLKNFNLDDLLDKIPIEENDELYDLKVFFNEHMADYEFEELLEYYNRQENRNLSIEEITDNFLEDKLNASLGSDKEFDTYLTNLIHYCFYNMDIKDFDSSFIYLIQMSVLASNKSTDKENILESNPHSIDIMYCIESLYGEKDFDIDGLFKKAVDGFRIDKYNNNHEEVLKELKGIFK